MLSDAEMIIVLIICDRIVYLIVYPGDHFYDHLLTQSMALYQSVALRTRLRRTSHHGMVKTGKMQQGYEG